MKAATSLYESRGVIPAQAGIQPWAPAFAGVRANAFREVILLSEQGTAFAVPTAGLDLSSTRRSHNAATAGSGGGADVAATARPALSILGL
jgi:hypothetical protein